MRFSKYIAVLAIGLASFSLNAQAQSCQTISPQFGAASLTLAPSSIGAVPTQCYFEPTPANGASFACVHGLPGTSANQQLLMKIALRLTLTTAEKSTLTSITSIRGGFAVDSTSSVPLSAREAIFANRTAFNSYINGNYTPPNSLPNLLISDIDTNDDSVSSVEIVATNDSFDGLHASGNLSTLTATLFHFIADSQNINGTYFLRIGSDLSTWTVCQNMPPAVNALIYNLLHEYQVSGASQRKIMLK